MTVGRLAGKTAIVTGGASGIGLATVQRFVAEGASVVFCDLLPEAGRELAASLGDAGKLHHSRRAAGGPNDGDAIAGELGARAVFVAADVTDQASLAKVFETAVKQFGGLDILVNNAGVGGGEGPIETCPRSLFDRTLAVNLLGPWLGIKLAFPLLRARGGGSIVTTSSVSALLGMPGQGAYGASKAAVLQLTRVAAIEGASDFIRVNAVCPGGVSTPIIYDSPLLARGIDPALVGQGLGRAQPLPRACQPEDVANTILWLASEESGFVTGQAINVDGGLTIEFDSKHRRQIDT
ncbi:SDR family oxidoreductase [Bradyrhizobium sp. INPA03-11B]|uniref:SDR family NAD(P)-dependent oxidoreductase n=1 Tax=Bradyrhizobium sp. INPA03-11B TaxID=418598 RepID=UPI00339053BE